MGGTQFAQIQLEVLHVLVILAMKILLNTVVVSTPMNAQLELQTVVQIQIVGTSQEHLFVLVRLGLLETLWLDVQTLMNVLTLIGTIAKILQDTTQKPLD